MSRPAPSGPVEKARHRVAREYRRQGYRIIKGGDETSLPEFLHDFRPDLVVEKGGDHVVVEIKKARDLKGANELKDLASRISQHEGWRLELIALASDEETDRQTSIQLDRLLAKADAAYSAGLSEVAFVYTTQLVELLLRAIAARHRVKGGDRPTMTLARELAFGGFIDDGEISAFEDVWHLRNQIIHAHEDVILSQHDFDRVARLCRALQRRLRD